MAKKKVRADQRLLDQGLVEDVTKAQALIMAGKVFTLKEEKILTAGQPLAAETDLYIKGQDKTYVSRGAYKLAQALTSFDLDVKGRIALDIGASTGGFTQVLLEAGAEKVYALDVGTNQLAWSLRQDDRVVVMEQTNFRYVQPADFDQGPISFASIDVSFISLKLIFPALSRIISDQGRVVALIKPQFEAKKEEVGENGIVSDPSVHQGVLLDILDFVAEDYAVLGLIPSPIRGSQGNREFLLHLIFDPDHRHARDFQWDKDLLAL